MTLRVIGSRTHEGRIVSCAPTRLRLQLTGASIRHDARQDALEYERSAGRARKRSSTGARQDALEYERSAGRVLVRALETRARQDALELPVP